MASNDGLIGKWVKSVQVSEAERTRADDPDHPFGTPAGRVGTLNSREIFQKPVYRAQPENMVIKSPGQDSTLIPEGYAHISEAIHMMMEDQMRINPLFRHARVELTYRQNPLPQTPARIVHTDPSRGEAPVEEDYVYFVASKQGTIVQAQHIKKPFETLNRMTPEDLVDEGLLKQAEPFEMMRGRQSTFHTQGSAIYESGRTFVRMIVTHPDLSYFRSLSDSEKAALPEDFRKAHGICASSQQAPGLH